MKIVCIMYSNVNVYIIAKVLAKDVPTSVLHLLDSC